MRVISRVGFSILFLLISWQISQAADAVAVVVLKRGKVNIVRASETRSQEARRGTALYDGDKVSTQDASLCGIKFLDDKSLLRIKENSTCTVEAKKVENKVNKNIIAELGSFFTKILQPGGSFSVTTPTSVASVKGTEWWTIRMQDGRDIYICLDGLIDLENDAGKYLLKVGQIAIFTSRDKSPEIRLLKAEDEVPTWEEDLGELRSLEIEFTDPDGKTRKMIIELEEKK